MAQLSWILVYPQVFVKNKVLAKVLAIDFISKI